MRGVGLFFLVLVIGLTGCRRPPSSATSQQRAPAAKADACEVSTGPLTREAAEREALKAVVKEAGRDHTCSIASVKDRPDTYEIMVRIDPPQTDRRQLPEHWTVEIPKAGITQSPDGGGG